MNKLIIYGIIFSVIFIIGFPVQESYSQYMGSVNPDQWSIATESAVRDLSIDVFFQNSTILKESIKTRISKAPEDSLPPTFHIRILYDQVQNGKIFNMDSVYKVDFGLNTRTPDNTKLEKIFENEYLPPNQIKNKKFEEFESYLTGLLQNIMCRQGFEKVVKESTDEALCVKLKSVGKLVDRGWVKMDYFTSKILQNENYDSPHVPISVNYVQPDSENPDYSWISTKIWNLRNIQSDYSVEVFNPEGEQVKICSKPSAESPQKPHSLNEWKTLLNSCGHSRMTGNYTVIVSLDSKHETFIVNVPK
ncbi:MAG TPA: hypothetical protein VMW74_07300 [Nitrosopumilaceae archaeon]|nr:hypothetical protein [Nitrosopumilaceae archaeon]